MAAASKSPPFPHTHLNTYSVPVNHIARREAGKAAKWRISDQITGMEHTHRHIFIYRQTSIVGDGVQEAICTQSSCRLSCLGENPAVSTLFPWAAHLSVSEEDGVEGVAKSHEERNRAEEKGEKRKRRGCKEQDLLDGEYEGHGWWWMGGVQPGETSLLFSAQYWGEGISEGGGVDKSTPQVLFIFYKTNVIIKKIISRLTGVTTIIEEDCVCIMLVCIPVKHNVLVRIELMVLDEHHSGKHSGAPSEFHELHCLF